MEQSSATLAPLTEKKTALNVVCLLLACKINAPLNVHLYTGRFINIIWKTRETFI